MKNFVCGVDYEPEPNTGCWLWLRGYQGQGYGSIKGKTAHSVSWAIAHGEEVPPGMIVCHKCDTPACINPKHLFLGTYQDNSKDMVTKGRHKPPQGRSHPRATLDEAAVKDILAQKDRCSTTVNRLAEKYGVTYSAIYSVLVGRTWKNVEGKRGIAQRKWVWTTKLSENDVLTIKRQLRERVHPNKIAETFGVSPCTVYNIRAGRIWRDIILEAGGK